MSIIARAIPSQREKAKIIAAAYHASFAESASTNSASASIQGLIPEKIPAVNVAENPDFLEDFSVAHPQLS